METNANDTPPYENCYTFRSIYNGGQYDKVGETIIEFSHFGFFPYAGWLVMARTSGGVLLFYSLITLIYGNVVCALAPIIIATTEVNYRIGYLAL